MPATAAARWPLKVPACVTYPGVMAATVSSSRSARPPTAPIGKPPPMILPSNVRSRRQPEVALLAANHPLRKPLHLVQDEQYAKVVGQRRSADRDQPTVAGLHAYRGVSRPWRPPRPGTPARPGGPRRRRREEGFGEYRRSAAGGDAL